MVQDVRIRFNVDNSDLDKTDKKLAEISEEEQKVASNAKKMSDAIKKGSKEAKDSTGELNTSIKSIGTAVVAAFTVDKILSFGAEVIRVRGEFQRLEAVLTNTLGGGSKAQLALGQIREFAAKTNFSVLELTQNYVKLANQGFVPTTNELTKLADVANSTGKSFDQLTEAIIDAQTGEFERLKEFGIRASKSGDEVKFTFKGVETQVDFTNSAIRNYILSLGELDGVQGSTAAISQTLEGQVSNLGDAYDSLLNTIGIRLQPAFTQLIGSASELLQLTQKLIETDGEAGQRQASQRANDLKEEIQARIKEEVLFAMFIKDKNKEYQEEFINSRTEAQKADFAYYSSLKENQKEAFEVLLRQLKRQQEREAEIVQGKSIAETRSIRERTKSLIEEANSQYKLFIEAEEKAEMEKAAKLAAIRAKEAEKEEKEREKREERRIKNTISRIRKLEKLENDYGSERVKTDKEIRQEALDSQMENTDETINLIQKEIDARNAALEAKRDIQDQEIQALYNLSNVSKTIFGESTAGMVAALVLEKVAAASTVMIKSSEAIASATAQAALLPPVASEAYLAKQIGLINFNRALSLAGIAASAIPQVEKFANGGYTGDGFSYTDDTGESVAGIVHRKEFVFDKNKTSRFRPLFEAIHRGEVTEKDINIKGNSSHTLDYGAFEAAIKRGFKAQPQNNINIDQNGFTYHVVSETRKVQLRNKRYSSK